MCETKDSLLLKGLQRSMIYWAPSGPGAIVSAEGWTHSCGGTYKLTNSWLGILGLRGLALTSLVKNDGAAATSNRASAITPSAPGDPLTWIPSSGGAQASLGTS